MEQSLHIDDLPLMRDPYFVMAFTGWNDAAESATNAARYLVDHLNGKRFAWINPDPFFQYSDYRPIVRRDTAGRRRIHWPKNEFFHCSQPDLPFDLVVGIGTEPHLNWKHFSRDILHLVRRCRATTAITMGALLAGELHTEPIHLVGLATRPELAERLGVEITKYEGPTGIVGVIHTLLQDEDIDAVSLWANVPHYIASLSNPKAVLALLKCLGRFGEIPLDLEDLENSTGRFDTQVEDVLAKNPRVAGLFSQLLGRGPGAGSEEGGGELPPGSEVADEIERLLRHRRNGGRTEEEE